MVDVGEGCEELTCDSSTYACRDGWIIVPDSTGHSRTRYLLACKMKLALNCNVGESDEKLVEEFLGRKDLQFGHHNLQKLPSAFRNNTNDL